MTDIKQLRKAFVDSAGDSLPDPGNMLELILGELLLYELAIGGELYDQWRYDIVFNGVNRTFGWTRVELHQKILEARQLLKSSPAPTKSIGAALSPESKRVLLQILDEVVLADCDDANFRNYLLEKIAVKLKVTSD